MAETVKPRAMRQAIADSIAEELKAYDVAAFCVRLGLAAQGEDEDPMRSKRVYIMPRLQNLGLPELITVARAVLAEWDDDALQDLVYRAAGGGGGCQFPKSAARSHRADCTEASQRLVSRSV